MLSRAKKQLSLAGCWNREFWHGIYEGVGDNESDWGEGRGRRFLRRLVFYSCAAALPLVGRSWVKESPERIFNFPKKSGRKTQWFPKVSFREKQTKRQRNTEEEWQRERGTEPSHLTLRMCDFSLAHFLQSPGTSSTRLFLNYPSSTGASCSHIFHPFPDKGYGSQSHCISQQMNNEIFFFFLKQKERGGVSQRGKYVALQGEERNQERREECEGRWTLYRLDRRRNGNEVARGDGRGPRQVWPGVNVFLETISQILLTGAASSVIGRRGDSERKGALDAPTAQSGRRVSRNSFPSPCSPSLACSIWTIYFSKSRERTAQCLCMWTGSPLRSSLAHSLIFTLSFFLALSQDSCV